MDQSSLVAGAASVVALAIIPGLAACGGDADGVATSASPPPGVAAAVVLWRPDGNLYAGNPAVISAAGKVLERPPIRPAASVAYDGSGALWVAKGQRSGRDTFVPGCDLWRTKPARAVIKHRQVAAKAAAEGLASRSAETHNLLCSPKTASSGGLSDTWYPDPGADDAVDVDIPEGAQSASQVSVAAGASGSGSTSDTEDGIVVPTWEGANLVIAESEPMGASSVTLKRPDGSSRVLWTEGAGLNVRSAQISRDGRWLFALAGDACGQCQADLYRAPLAEGPAGATENGGPTRILPRVQMFAVPPPGGGSSALPPASADDASVSRAAPTPSEILVNDLDIPGTFTDMGASEESEGLSSDFLTPGDPCTPEGLEYRVRNSAAQVLSGPEGLTVSVLVMDMNTRERAQGEIDAMKKAGRACATDSSGVPSLIGGGIGAMNSWHATSRVSGYFAIIDTTLAQATGTGSIVSHGGRVMFAQGPYVVRINVSALGVSATKITDPLSLEPAVRSAMATTASAQAKKIREQTGNRPT